MPGTCAWGFCCPIAVAASPADGVCWVADADNSQVVRLAITGWQPPIFHDVPFHFWAFEQLGACFYADIISGHPDELYHPDYPVTRDQMAVFLARALVAHLGEWGLISYTPPDTPTFPDVAPDFWAYKHIEYIADPERAILHGYPDGEYHPEHICSRDQMAVCIGRAFQLPM